MIELHENIPEHIDVTLDTRGLHCPLPILKTKAELSKMQPGEILHVTTTDPLAPLDFKSYAVRASHTLIYMSEEEDHAEFYLKRGDD